MMQFPVFTSQCLMIIDSQRQIEALTFMCKMFHNDKHNLSSVYWNASKWIATDKVFLMCGNVTM